MFKSMCHCHGNVFCIQILESICQWQGNIFCIQVQKYLSACKVGYKGYKGWVKVWKPDSVAARCISVRPFQAPSSKYRCLARTNTDVLDTQIQRPGGQGLQIRFAHSHQIYLRGNQILYSFEALCL